MKNIAFRIGILGLIWGVGSCTISEIPTDNLYQEWTIHQASRNNETTTSLEGLYFHFLDENEVITNLVAAEADQMMYKKKGNKISLQGDPEITLDITSFKDDTLKLKTKILDNLFEFVLIPSEMN